MSNIHLDIAVKFGRFITYKVFLNKHKIQQTKKKKHTIKLQHRRISHDFVCNSFMQVFTQNFNASFCSEQFLKSYKLKEKYIGEDIYLGLGGN